MPIDWEWLESTYDWFRDMKGVPQDAIWHAEGDVFVHTKMVVEALLGLPEFAQLTEKDKHILFAAAMMHDIEKRSTTVTEIINGEERIVSPRHAKIGEYTTRTILYKDIETPFYIREEVAKLVRLHGLPLWAIDKADPRKAVIEASLAVNTKHVSMLAKADILGRICSDQEEMLMRIALFDELCKEHNCHEQSFVFASDYGRYQYLNKENVAPDYNPYDDLKCTVTVMCALPGSGKDTYIRERLKGLPVLSLDEIRRVLKIEPTNKKGNGQIIQMGKEKAKEFLRAKTDFVFNATNVTTDMRGKWISLFIDYGARVRIVYIEVPYKKLITQNHHREYKVPQQVVDRLIDKLEIPSFREAHEVVYMIGY
ncbi:MAG: AAA family ATPase [Chitinophagales bacterium]|nr:AAA family ATPase [Chitinophagales bacterium]